MRFTLNPIALGIVAVQTALCVPFASQAAALGPYNPRDNDQQNGALIVTSGSQTLTGNQAFETGSDGATNTTLGQVSIVSGAGFINGRDLIPARKILLLPCRISPQAAIRPFRFSIQPVW